MTKEDIKISLRENIVHGVDRLFGHGDQGINYMASKEVMSSGTLLSYDKIPSDSGQVRCAKYWSEM
jgi:hypothetical protein